MAAALAREVSLGHQWPMRHSSLAGSLAAAAFLRQASLKPAASVVDQHLTDIRGRASHLFSWVFSECAPQPSLAFRVALLASSGAILGVLPRSLHHAFNRAYCWKSASAISGQTFKP
jgi:hypothetical protein